MLLAGCCCPPTETRCRAAESLLARTLIRAPVLAVGLGIVAVIQRVSMFSWGLPFLPLAVGGVIVLAITAATRTGCTAVILRGNCNSRSSRRMAERRLECSAPTTGAGWSDRRALVPRTSGARAAWQGQLGDADLAATGWMGRIERMGGSSKHGNHRRK